MEAENVKIVRQMYDAFAAGDLPGVLSRFDPDIVWNEAENFPYADGNPYTGPDAVVAGVFQRLMDDWDYWNLDLERFLDAGDAVVAMGRYKARNSVTGSTISAQFAHVWELRDGKAVSFQQYADTAQVAAAVARAGSS